MKRNQWREKIEFLIGYEEDSVMNVARTFPSLILDRYFFSTINLKKKCQLFLVIWEKSIPKRLSHIQRQQRVERGYLEVRQLCALLKAIPT